MPDDYMHYSGLVTKTRAMSHNLLKREEINRLTGFATVNELVNFLKGTRGYGDLYGKRDDICHRGQAEGLLTRSLYLDFEKLYKFVDIKQRKVIQYVFSRYEADTLKLLYKSFFQKEAQKREIYVDPFFYKHACFSVKEIKQAATLQEFGQILIGTPYERIFRKTTTSSKNEYAEHAMRLDIFYYVSVYKDIKKMKHSEVKDILLTIYGTQIDCLNSLWKYRAKHFYDQTAAEIAAIMIPYTYRLKNKELVIENEISYYERISTMYQQISRRYPVSIAPVLQYLYEKQQEIRRLTTIIEGIRYQISPYKLKELILITT